jgi:cysteine-rich repeat protein
MNTGGYNGCTADCKRGPFCGDSVVQPDHEQCDDGINITIYSMSGMPGCAPGCAPSSFCGDEKVDSLFGEQCDLGTAMNTGAYDGCTPTCQLGPRCGDGVVQRDKGEQCDDGNTVGGDGCTHDCHNEIVP